MRKRLDGTDVVVDPTKLELVLKKGRYWALLKVRLADIREEDCFMAVIDVVKTRDEHGGPEAGFETLEDGKGEQMVDAFRKELPKFWEHFDPLTVTWLRRDDEKRASCVVWGSMPLSAFQNDAARERYVRSFFKSLAA